MKKINYLIASLITLLISTILFLVSGITKEHILMPMSISIEIFNEINFGVLFSSIVFFSISISIISVFLLKNEKFDITLLLVPFIGSIAIFAFTEISLMSLFLGLALIIGVMVMGRSIISEKEEYKKLNSYKISTHSSSKMLLIISLIITLTVYIQLDTDTSYAQDTTDELLETTTGLTQENLTDIDAAIKEQQRDAAYAYIDVLSDTYIETLETTGDLTEAQRKKCLDAFQNDLDEFDRKSKDTIDKQLEKPSEFNSSDKLSTVVYILELFEKFYALLVAITIFSLLSALNSVLIIPLIGLFSWILWRINNNSEKKEIMKNYTDSNSDNKTETSQLDDIYYES